MSRNTPAGKYAAVAVPMTGQDDGTKIIRFGEASTGTAQIIIYFRIIRGERAGDTLPWFGSMTPDSYERTLQSVRYAGWKGDDISRPGDLDQEVEIEVEVSEWQGKERSKIAWVNAPGGGAFKLERPIEGQALAAFVAKVKQYSRKVGEVDGPRVDRSAPIDRSPATEDRDDGEHRVERDEEQRGGSRGGGGGGGDSRRGSGSGSGGGGRGGWGSTREDPRGSDWGESGPPGGRAAGDGWGNSRPVSGGGGGGRSSGVQGKDDDIPF